MGTVLACSSGESTMELMSNESQLLDVLAAARNRNGDLQWKIIVKCVTSVVSWEQLGIAKI